MDLLATWLPEDLVVEASLTESGARNVLWFFCVFYMYPVDSASEPLGPWGVAAVGWVPGTLCVYVCVCVCVCVVTMLFTRRVLICWMLRIGFSILVTFLPLWFCSFEIRQSLWSISVLTMLFTDTANISSSFVVVIVDTWPVLLILDIVQGQWSAYTVIRWKWMNA